MKNMGTPWVNTLAADRHGNTLYADVSVVPDVDAAQLQRCAPSKPAAALLPAAGLVVLDGSKSACDWRATPPRRAGLIPIGRMPTAIRTDWVHNSNDGFAYTHPAQKWSGISPLVGDAVRHPAPHPRRPAGDPGLLAAAKVTPQAVQAQLFADRNFMGHVLPDLLAACTANPPSSAEARDGCAALRGWDRTSSLDARGAHLFREFWRTARPSPACTACLSTRRNRWPPRLA
jgi:acyl-homoserine-lactone acylase